MSEGVVRKIQPFTIGTRLSVPSEHKCHSCADVYSPRAGAGKDGLGGGLGDPGPLAAAPNPEPPRAPERVDSPDALEEREGEERNSVSPTASSRSIRKIAICGNADRVSHTHTSVTAAFGTSHDHTADDPHQASMTDEGLNKSSNPQSKVDLQFKRKLRDQQYGCGVLGSCPPQVSEDRWSTQQRGIKDIENSLIQLTRSLDVNQDRQRGDVDTDPREENQEEIQRADVALRDPITQTCLWLQTLLRNYHQDLKLALDVSSFYQQADNVIFDINNKRSGLTGSKDHRWGGDAETRDIHSQITMLNEAAWQLADLHPTLAARLTRKQAEVHESWRLLQGENRNARPQLSTTCMIDLTCGDPRSPTPAGDVQGTVEHEAHRILGKDFKEEQNRLKGFEVMHIVGVHDKSKAGVNEGSPPDHGVQVPGNSAGLRGERRAREREDQMTNTRSVPGRDGPELSLLLQDSTTSADKTLSWLEDNIAMSTSHQHMASLDGPGTKHQTPDMNHHQVILERALAPSKREGAIQAQGDVKMQDLLQQAEMLWEVLRRRQEQGMINTDSSERHNLEMDTVQGPMKEQHERLKSESRQPMDDGQLCIIPGVKNLPAALEDCGSGMMLTELLNCLEQDKSPDLDWQITTGPTMQNAECVSDPMEELLGVLEDLSEAVEKRGLSLFQSPDTQDLMCQHSTLMLRIKQLQSRCAELSMDILDTETDMALRCDPENSGLEGLQEQQDELQMDYQVIKEKVAEMERLACRMNAVLPEKAGVLVEHVQRTLQDLEELGWSVAENQSRLREFCHLQDFLKTYLAMISWTDETRTYIFSEASAHQSEPAESAMPSELDLRIHQKFEDFDKFAAAGQKLIAGGHHLTDIVKERTDELQSMLGWMLVHWRAKKDQRNQQKPSDSVDVTSLPDTTVVSTCQPQNPQTRTESKSLLSTHKQAASEVHVTGPEPPAEGGPPGHSSSTSTYRCHQAPVEVEATSSSLVLEEPRPSVTPLGGSIELILSFDQQTATPSQSQGFDQQTATPSQSQGFDQQRATPSQSQGFDQQTATPSQSQGFDQQRATPSQSQGFEQQTATPSQSQGFDEQTATPSQSQGCLEQMDPLEPVHRVSTYLQVIDGNKAESPICKEVPSPTIEEARMSPIPQTRSTTETFIPTVSTVVLPSGPKTCLTSTITLKNTANKRKKVAHRHTVVGITGVDKLETAALAGTSHRPNTWPLETAALAGTSHRPNTWPLETAALAGTSHRPNTWPLETAALAGTSHRPNTWPLETAALAGTSHRPNTWPLETAALAGTSHRPNTWPLETAALAGTSHRPNTWPLETAALAGTSHRPNTWPLETAALAGTSHRPNTWPLETAALAGTSHRPNTWPLEDKQGARAEPGSPVNTELQLYIRNNSVVTIAGANSSGTSKVPSIQGHCMKPLKNSDGHEKNHYSIPLGSMLSFDLPTNWENVSQMNSQDLALGNGEFDSPNKRPLNSYRSSVSEPTFSLSSEEEPGCERGEKNSVSSLENPQRVSSLENQQRVSSLENPQRVTSLENPQRVSSLENPQRVSSLENPQRVSSLENPQRVSSLENPQRVSSPENPQREPDRCPTATKHDHTEPDRCPTATKHDHTEPDYCPTATKHDHTEPDHCPTATKHDHTEPDHCPTATKHDHTEPDRCPTATKHDHTEPDRCPMATKHDHTCTEALQNHHKCLSVHTKICDLNGHIYRLSAKKQFTPQTSLIVQEVRAASPGTEGSNWGPRGSGHAVVCAQEECSVCPERPVPRMAPGKEGSPSGSLGRELDPVHPDHWQFEEEEEELEDIWNGMGQERSP